jgi:hypothetical protein
LGFQVSVIYSIIIDDDQRELDYLIDLLPDFGVPNELMLKVGILYSGKVILSVKKDDIWHPISIEGCQFPIPRLVGYSSGLNENLQRNKKGRSQIKSRYVICLAIDACLTINTQNKKGLS